MQGIWRDVWNPLSKTQRKSIRMQRKLFLCWSPMLLVIFFIFLVVLNVTGTFSALEKEMQQILSGQQKHVVADLSEQFDKITAQGITVSEQSSASINNYLFTDPVASLDNDPERIEELESLLYGYLTASLQSAPCSGAYLVLDATTNSQAPGAQFSRAGLYIRLTNLSSKGTANQDLVFYRGVPNVAREHQLELHNRWKLEFDISKLPGYNEMLDRSAGRLAANTVWTKRMCLPDTWENAMLLMVPIMGNNGSVLGICGLELSELYFMLSYPSVESRFGNMVTLLAPMSGDSVGDFLLWRKTLCDGEVILSLLQVNNGDSTFSVCFNDWAPILRRYTGWTSQGEIRKGETFCGAAWKVDYETQTVWLDDITEDGRNIGRYEALPYQAAPQLDLYSLPDWSLENGAVWMVRTDAMGRIEEMQPYFNGTCEQLTEEEAAELLCEVYEVQEYLNMGMKMFFDGTRETINDESCVVITLGTDHEESFVRELFYAVAPSGAIYAYDLFNDSWNEVGVG